MASDDRKFGEFLVARQQLSSMDVNRALQAQAEMGGLLGQVLIRLGLLSEQVVLQALSEQLQLPLLESADYPDSPVDPGRVSLEFLQNNQVVPVSADSSVWRFAAMVPQDPYLHKALSLASAAPVVICLGAESDIAAALQKYLPADDPALADADDAGLSADQNDEFVEHLRDLASEAPVIRIVHQLFNQALDLGASDIHIEPFEQQLLIRFRVDGVIQEMQGAPDLSQAAAITSRIKLLANLNIAERRLPQDGRIMTRVKGHELDLRVSTIPTVYGESVVMRVLDRQSIRLSLTSMGFADDVLARYRELLHRPHGVLLLTGPTGSGKTTTLYASLSSLDRDTQKIITVEDPVEYQLSGINQIQVQPLIELTFAKALRSILRQDPDIIMIGEMRDTETAQIAVQSALTGHLVLSTLHTNTAAGAITRLSDMGVERYLITSSVNAVLSQRLVRKLCRQCREKVTLSEEVIRAKGLDAWMPAGQTSIYKACGCDACKHSGYAGRTSIHELLVMTDRLSRAVLEGQDALVLHQLARSQGMRTLYEDGLLKVAEGVTSLEEVLRVTQDQVTEGMEPDAKLLL